MHFFEMYYDIYREERWELGETYSPSGLIDEWNFTIGKAYESSEPMSVTSEGGPPMDFNMAAFDVPIISSVGASIIQQYMQDDVQLIPVEIDGSDSWGDKWFIVNVLKKVKCVNEERSLFTKWTDDDGRPDKTGKFRMVVKLAINNSGLDNIHLFRIEDWDVALIISSELREKLDNAGVDGIVYTPVT